MIARRLLLLLIAATAAQFAEGATAEREPSEFTDINAVLLAARVPEYSENARAKRLSGWGIVQLEIDRGTGLVRRAYMERSTGETILDKSALAAYSQWRFLPGSISHARLPVVFTTGGSAGSVSYEFHEKPMEKVLARFLGNDNAIKASLPAYPTFPPWTLKSGRGIYELHVGADGMVGEVKILKHSGDETFDRITVRGLGKWRFRHGPVTLEVPLHFMLTPISYSVDVAR
ncbi:MAG: TonB family protein [Chthoniobacterales bacterium]